MKRKMKTKRGTRPWETTSRFAYYYCYYVFLRPTCAHDQNQRRNEQRKTEKKKNIMKTLFRVVSLVCAHRKQSDRPDFVHYNHWVQLKCLSVSICSLAFAVYCSFACHFVLSLFSNREQISFEFSFCVAWSFESPSILLYLICEVVSIDSIKTIANVFFLSFSEFPGAMHRWLWLAATDWRSSDEFAQHETRPSAQVTLCFAETPWRSMSMCFM